MIIKYPARKRIQTRGKYIGPNAIDITTPMHTEGATYSNGSLVNLNILIERKRLRRKKATRFLISCFNKKISQIRRDLFFFFFLFFCTTINYSYAIYFQFKLIAMVYIVALFYLYIVLSVVTTMATELDILVLDFNTNLHPYSRSHCLNHFIIITVLKTINFFLKETRIIRLHFS